MQRKHRLAIAIVVAAGLIGWNQWQRHRAGDTAEAAPAAAIRDADGPAPKRRLGSLEFEPCALPLMSGAAKRSVVMAA